MANVKKIGNIITSPALLHITLPILMLYLIVGTVAQKYIGLYEATQIFFSDPILWIGGIPLPGLPIFLALIFVNLFCHLIFKTKWTIRNSGVVITHLGALLLIFGGLITAQTAREGYIDFAQGQSRQIVSDYHQRSVAIVTGEDDSVHVRYDHNALLNEKTVQIPGTNIEFEILEICENCEIVPRQPQEGQQYFGMAQHMQLQSKPPEMKNEENLAGLTIKLRGTENDGIYTILEHIPRSPELIIKDQSHKIVIRKKQRPIPFSVELLEFKKELHPASNLAKSYQSRVRIIDGQSRWESTIRMNEPLRYKGYTFYQSSFLQTPEGIVSVLSVVKNSGRLFPYLSGLLMCLGLMMHFFVRKPVVRK